MCDTRPTVTQQLMKNPQVEVRVAKHAYYTIESCGQVGDGAQRPNRCGSPHGCRAFSLGEYVKFSQAPQFGTTGRRVVGNPGSIRRQWSEQSEPGTPAVRYGWCSRTVQPRPDRLPELLRHGSRAKPRPDCRLGSDGTCSFCLVNRQPFEQRSKVPCNRRDQTGGPLPRPARDGQRCPTPAPAPQTPSPPQPEDRNPPRTGGATAQIAS